jgi:hypothetical protein
MSAATQAATGRSRYKKALLALIPILVIGGGVAGFLAYSANLPMLSHASGTNASSPIKVDFAVSIHHQEQRSADFAWLAQMALKGQFWSASCYVSCANGVTYKLDPQPFVVDQGQDFEQCRLFGVTKNLAYTCSSNTNLANVEGVSTSATALSVTDTYASATAPCGGTLIASTNGLGIVAAGTVTAGTPSGSGTTQGSTVVTIANTFTDATATTSNVQDACLLTGTTGTIYIVAEGNFGPDTLAVGNTLTITWTMTLS